MKRQTTKAVVKMTDVRAAKGGVVRARVVGVEKPKQPGSIVDRVKKWVGGRKE